MEQVHLAKNSTASIPNESNLLIEGNSNQILAYVYCNVVLNLFACFLLRARARKEAPNSLDKVRHVCINRLV